MKRVFIFSLVFCFILLLFYTPSAKGKTFTYPDPPISILVFDTLPFMPSLYKAYGIVDKKPDSAIAIIQNIIALSEKKQLDFEKAWAMEKMADLYLYMKDYSKALDVYKKTLGEQEQLLNQPSQIILCNKIGFLYDSQSNYLSALEFYLKALSLQEQSNDLYGIIKNANRIGTIYRKLGNPEAALRYYRKALTILQSLHDQRGIVSNLNNIANLYTESKQYHLAMEYYERELLLNQELQDEQGIGYAYHNIGNLLFIRGEDNNKAFEFLQNARNIFLKNVDKDQYILCENAILIAECLMRRNNIQKAKELAGEALIMARERQDLLLIEKATFILSKLYKKEKDYSKALEYFEWFKIANDSIQNHEKIRILTEIESKTDLERKEQQINFLEIKQKLNEIKAKSQEENFLNAFKQINIEKALAESKVAKDKVEIDNLNLKYREKNSELILLRLKDSILVLKNKSEEAEINAQKEINEFQNIITYFIVSILLGVILFTYLLYRSHQKEKKIREKIEIQHEEIVTQSEILKELNDTKDKLFSIIGHDLRSPISSLKGLLDLVEQGMISQEEFRAFSPKLQRSVYSVHETLENLLQWSYSQMKGIQSVPAYKSLRPIIDEILNLFAEIAGSKKIKILDEISLETMVFADENHIKLIIRNLVNNAIKFTPPEGQIRLYEVQQQNQVCVCVEDNGIGMSKEQKDTLFKSSSNISTQGTEGEKGTGLGLLLCKEMVEKNGGRIWVESMPGKGTTFCFTLPKNAPR